MVIGAAVEQPRYLGQEIGVNAQLTQSPDIQIAERLAFILRKVITFPDILEIAGEIRKQRRIAADLENHPVGP